MNFYELIKDLNFTSVIWQLATPLFFSFVDIITGYIQAVINHNVDSQKMRTGLLHKFLIVLVIISSFIIQFAFDIKFISAIVCIYVALMEIVSNIENLEKAGLDLGRLGNIIKNKTDETTAESVNKLIETITISENLVDEPTLEFKKEE